MVGWPQTKYKDLPPVLPTLDPPAMGLLDGDTPVVTGNFTDGRRIATLEELLQKVDPAVSLYGGCY